MVIWSDRCTIIVSINYNIISLQNSNERLFYNIQLNSDNRNNSGIIHIQLFTLNIDYEVTSNGGPTQYPYHMTGVTRRTGTVYTSASPEFNPGVLWGSCCSIFSLMCSVCLSLFVLFLFTIVLSVLLRSKASDYTFGSFKHVLYPS